MFTHLFDIFRVVIRLSGDSQSSGLDFSVLCPEQALETGHSSFLTPTNVKLDASHLKFVAVLTPKWMLINRSVTHLRQILPKMHFSIRNFDTRPG